MNWYIGAIKKYATFNGRARRKEYWYFLLFSMLITLALRLIDGATGLYDPDYGYGALGGIYALAILLPSIAVGVRRLHDTDRSAWWCLIILIPIIGAIVLIMFAMQNSSEGANKYGDNPKYIENVT